MEWWKNWNLPFEEDDIIINFEAKTEDQRRGRMKRKRMIGLVDQAKGERKKRK